MFLLKCNSHEIVMLSIMFSRLVKEFKKSGTKAIFRHNFSGIWNNVGSYWGVSHPLNLDFEAETL